MLDSTMIEMMNLTPVPEGVIKQIRKSSRSNLAKVAAAFRWLDKQADSSAAAKYAGKVDASEFIVRRADNEIDLFQGPAAEIEVDGTNPDLSTDIDYAGLAPTNFDGMDSIPGVLDEVSVSDPFGEEQIPVELMDERGGASRVEIDDPAEVPEYQDVEPAPVNMEVDFFGQGGMDINLDGEQEIQVDEPLPIFDSLDVDPNAGGMDVTSPADGDVEIDFSENPEPEFQGIDEIEFDESPDKPGDLDIMMNQDWNP
jgi:hypothetical protein